MRVWVWLTGISIAAGAFAVTAAEPPAAVEAVRPGGPGILTKCRSWLVASSCHRYHHISLPARITVGDSIPLSFGSSNKEFVFPVVRIALEGDRCTLFSNRDGDREHGDKVEISPCYPAQESR